MSSAQPQQVGDDVWCIRTTGSWALAANSYVVRSRGVTALIDTGFPSATDALFDGLGACGVSAAGVDVVLYTHTHPDHMGGGIAASSRLGGRHVVWDGTVPAFGDYAAFYEALPSWQDWLGEILPEGPVREATLSLFPPRLVAASPGDGRLPRPESCQFGGTVQVGACSFTCVDLRGHDPYHVGWFERERGWLFAGDVLLGTPTPILPILRDDLATYRDTVHRIGELEVRRLFPGHGRPTDAYADAVARSRGHTRELYGVVASLLDAGLVDPSALLRGAAPASPGDRRRLFVTLGGVMSQLAEFERCGAARVRPDRRWEPTGRRPSFEDLLGHVG